MAKRKDDVNVSFETRKRVARYTHDEYLRESTNRTTDLFHGEIFMNGTIFVVVVIVAVFGEFRWQLYHTLTHIRAISIPELMLCGFAFFAFLN